LRARPGLRAAELALGSGLALPEVTQALYGPLAGRVAQDSQYRWFLTPDLPESEEAVVPALSKAPNTLPPLTRLSQYFLACLSQDSEGVAVASQTKSGTPDYIELPALPQTTADLLSQLGAPELINKLRQDRSRLTLYLGYPVSVQSDTVSKVAPVLLFPVEMVAGRPQLDLSYPILNQKAVAQFTGLEREGVLNELVVLESELGFASGAEAVGLEEQVLRLQALRPDWPWLEPCAPSKLASVPALSKIRKAGIYNRAILLVTERSPYTRGLESELIALSQMPPELTDGTALGQWLRELPAEPAVEHLELIEVLPMNSEQRQAVTRALTQPLTVITGPPGTGKSQVVANLLVNCAWHGKRVLFASKNNKAVDVVEARVNALGPRPVLLRVGANEYQSRLSGYLTALLGASANEEDLSTYEAAKAARAALITDLAELERQAASLIAVRNRVDRLEQAVERIREQRGADWFLNAWHRMPEDDDAAITHLQNTVTEADRERHNFLTRLAWRFKRRQRFAELNLAIQGITRQRAWLGVVPPAAPPTDENLEVWHATAAELRTRFSEAIKVLAYLRSLATLQDSKSLDEISAEQAQVLSEMPSRAHALWEAWVRLHPTRLQPAARGSLTRYSALLKMMLDAGGGTSASHAYREQQGMFQEVSALLPCWATTSLSARGKIPFEPGIFDLVVFDEASQNDIASALPLLYRAKRAVVIGDPQQLSHISGLQPGQDQQLLARFGLLPGRLNWSHSCNSLFDLAAGLVRSEHIVNLRDHHRSHADIIEFSNKYYYEGRLRVATRYASLRAPDGEAPGVRWVDTKGHTVRPTSGGAVNSPEAQAVVAVLQDLMVTRKFTGTVGVVTPFRVQASLIRDLASKVPELVERMAEMEFLVDTVHKFQGDERDVMIFSPVVSSAVPESALRFLRHNSKLFNVALTRARAQLIVVGDLQACSQCGVDYLASFAGYYKSLGRANAPASEVVTPLGEEYPTGPGLENVSVWEKALYRALYTAGLRPLPQHPVEKYAIDLALVSGESRLAIEVDGDLYHRDWTGDVCRRDILRTQRLIELGWAVRRFWVYEIRDDLDGCVDRVLGWLGQPVDG
jgi:very-short-patch-repair endonuclease